MECLDELLRNIAGWQKDDPRFLSIVDNNRAFLECMLEQVQRERKPLSDNITWDEAFRPSKVSVTSVSLKNWLNMWSRLCRGSAGMDDFPIWVQLLPKVLLNKYLLGKPKFEMTKTCPCPSFLFCGEEGEANGQ